MTIAVARKQTFAFAEGKQTRFMLAGGCFPQRHEFFFGVLPIQRLVDSFEKYNSVLRNVNQSHRALEQATSVSLIECFQNQASPAGCRNRNHQPFRKTL